MKQRDGNGMICLKERRNLRNLLSDFADGRLSGREFARSLDEFAGSMDATIREIAFNFSMYHDGDKRRKGRALIFQHEWDEIQRSLLFLDSNSQIVEEKVVWIFNWVQIPAVLAGIVAIWQYQIESKRFEILLPWAVVAVLFALRLRPWLCWRRAKQDVTPVFPIETVSPFNDVQSMVRALRATPGFKKCRQPQYMRRHAIELTSQTRKSDIVFECFLAAVYLVAFIYIGWPLILFILCLPWPRTKPATMEIGKTPQRTEADCHA